MLQCFNFDFVPGSCTDRWAPDSLFKHWSLERFFDSSDKDCACLLSACAKEIQAIVRGFLARNRVRSVLQHQKTDRQNHEHEHPQANQPVNFYKKCHAWSILRAPSIRYHHSFPDPRECIRTKRGVAFLASKHITGPKQICCPPAALQLLESNYHNQFNLLLEKEDGFIREHRRWATYYLDAEDDPFVLWLNSEHRVLYLSMMACDFYEDLDMLLECASGLCCLHTCDDWQGVEFFVHWVDDRLHADRPTNLHTSLHTDSSPVTEGLAEAHELATLAGIFLGFLHIYAKLRAQ